MIQKSTLILIVFLGLFSCETPKNYVKFSGKITNATSDVVTLSNLSGYSKTIKVKKDGSFSDTLHLENKKELFSLNLNKKIHVILKNGDNIHVTVNTAKVEESLEFSGKGSEINNYVIAKLRLQKSIDRNALFKLEKEDFDKKALKITADFTNLLQKYIVKDSIFYNKELKDIKDKSIQLANQYTRVHSPLEGKVAPIFNDYQNAIKGVTSLYDLKGKYVYISIWKTSESFLKEVPFMNSMVEEFKNKNIHFVGISKDSNKDEWLESVKNNKMKGIQLLAKEGDVFMRDFSIHTVPRYILVDPKGIVVNANMTSPSDSKTKKTLKKLTK